LIKRKERNSSARSQVLLTVDTDEGIARTENGKETQRTFEENKYFFFNNISIIREQNNRDEVNLQAPRLIISFNCLFLQILHELRVFLSVTLCSYFSSSMIHYIVTDISECREITRQNGKKKLNSVCPFTQVS
jgi:hypothetical protein